MRLIQDGPSNARIMLVGESPGKNEIAAGKPFVGGSGELLDRMLSKSGISRRDCFITNVCHVQPPGDEWKWFERKENQHHLIHGLLQLKSDIERIKPNLVIALGAQPLKLLTGKTGIDKWRGSILASRLVPGVKVIGTYHPAYCLRVYDYKAVVELDLRKCALESFVPTIQLPRRKIILPDGYWLRDGVGVTEWTWVDEPWDLELERSRLLSANHYAGDIECYHTPSGWSLACMGFSADPSEALVIPADSGRHLNAIRELAQSPKCETFQNGNFDVTVLRDSGIYVPNFRYDTMLAHHTLYAESAGGGDEMAALAGTKRQAAIAKGLAFLTSINTNEPFYKDDGKLWKQTDDKRLFFRYNGLDCCVTQESRIVQEQDMETLGVTQAFRSTMELCYPVMEATRIGLGVNRKRRQEMLDRVDMELHNLQTFLDASAGGSVNVSSNKQITELLYDRLKLPPKLHKISGNPTANADAIVELAGKYNHPVLLTILKIRERRVLRERYLATPLDPDGRIRCSFDLAGTRSYRLSSRASLSGSGTNLQNQPESIREVYEADPGTVFIYPDYSQAEARLVAYLAEDDWLIKLFQDPTRDLHKETAAAIFNKPVESVTDTERQLGKKSRHALNYGMFAKRFVEVVNSDSDSTGIRINQSFAQQIIDGFFLLHPNHKSVYWARVERELRQSRTLRNPFGYARTFFGRWDDALLRDAYSWVPQSTIGVLGRLAWVAVDKAVRPLGGHVLLNVHDSLLVQSPIDMAEPIAMAVQDAMRIPFEINGYTAVIPTDCKAGYNWGNRGKDGSNPNGLRKLAQWLESPARLAV